MAVKPAVSQKGRVYKCHNAAVLCTAIKRVMKFMHRRSKENVRESGMKREAYWKLLEDE